MLKVSFDFDATLSTEHIQKYAKELIERGIEVWIVTSRWENVDNYKHFINATNDDLFKVAEDLGIPRERIHFTNMEDKWEFLKDKDFIVHLDDDWVENKMILKYTKTKAVNSFGNSSWRQKCERILKRGY